MPDATVNGAPAGPRKVLRRGLPPPLNGTVALFLDIDGTLLDLALTPERVRVDGDIAWLLPALTHWLDGAVALITGRTIADADRLFPGLVLPVAGQHGAERRAADGTLRRHRRPPPEFVPLRRELERFVARHEGLLLEDKGATLAVHYRQTPTLASHVHRTLRTELMAVMGNGAWRLQSGKGILEVRPDGRDKGRAIDEYMEEAPFRGRLPVFVGDDTTDEFGFEAVNRRHGWAIKVGRGPTHARYRLPHIAAVRRWLGDALLPETLRT